MHSVLCGGLLVGQESINAGSHIEMHSPLVVVQYLYQTGQQENAGRSFRSVRVLLPPLLSLRTANSVIHCQQINCKLTV